MTFSRIRPVLAAVLVASLAVPLVAADAGKKQATAVYPAAVFAFQERGEEAKGLGGKVTDLLVANLIARPEMFLVDREELKKVLEEQALNLSGVVKPSEATRVGELTGAKLLVTGSVIQIETRLYLVAKIIGTETSRVLGASVKGKTSDDLGNLVKELADEVAKTVASRAGELVAKPASREDRLAALKERLPKGKRPAVLLKIPERHVGQAAADPAAQTELAILCDKLGFRVIDADHGSPSEADVLVTGEGVAEFAARHGNLISVKGRLELKAIDRRSGRLLAVDRQVSLAVDLTEQLAGKAALEEAAAKIAERVLPKLVQAGGK